MPIWAIVLIAAGAVILLLFLLAAVVDRIPFCRRYDKNPLLKYFTAEDFGLTADPVPLKDGLFGHIYDKTAPSKNEKWIIFVHGMGPGHVAYMTEIAYFCNLGYSVLAVDSRGCNYSAGKNMKGMYEGVKTAVAAIDFVKKNFPEKRIYLVGHSWGGYSALCASAERKVSGVVAISAPDTPVKTLYGGAAPIISKPLATVLRPFWRVINFLKFGFKGNANAVKCARKNGTPTLLIHGDRDKVVPPEKAAYYGVYGENVTKIIAKSKAHNPYNTVAAEAELAGLSAKLSDRKTPREEKIKFVSEFDFKAATEEDEEIMSAISDFIAKN